MITTTLPACASTPQATDAGRRPSRVNQIIAFNGPDFYRLYTSWQEAAAALNLKKHEFYFALKNGTPIATHDNGNMPAEVFVDIYVGEAERARIRQATAIRKSWQAAAVANAAGKEVSAP